MGSFQNSIMLGVKLPQKNDIQSQLNNLIKELNNSKITLDVNFKDNSVIQTLEKLNNILNQTKQSASGVNLGNISGSLKQVTEEAVKLTSELKGVSSINLKINDGELKNVKVTMQDTEQEAKKLNQSLKETNGGSMFGGMSDFLAKAGLFYGVAQGVQEVKTQLTNCFEQAEKLDKAFTDISITMNISKEQFKNMSDQITAMGVEYGKSGNEVMNIAKTYANAQSSVEEVMAKVKPDLWLANVSRIDSADITKTIQSVCNQFGLMTKEGMNAEQATTKIGNSLVAVSKNLQFDFVDGIKKITEAVKIGGSVAENSKMSLDDFISMTGAFVQQSGQSGTEFANSLKFVSARILKQKELGAELGISEKQMADAEKALSRFNISTRDDKGLRSLTDILKDTSVVFNKCSDSDRQYLANKLAGTNQSARFIDIMKSMQNQQVLYNATQTDTTALMDAQQKYAESLEGRLGSLKATYEGLMNKAMNSDTAKYLVTEATQFLNVLGSLDGKSIAYIATIGGLSIAMVKLVSIYKELKALNAITEAQGLAKFVSVLLGMNAVTNSAGVAITGLEGAFVLLGQGIEKAIVASVAFISTPIGAVITTVGACLAVAVGGFVSYQQHQADLAEQSKSLKSALEGVNTALKGGDTTKAQEEADKIKNAQEKLQQYIELKEKAQNASATSFNPTAGGTNQSAVVDGWTRKIAEYEKVLKDAGYTIDETTGKIKEFAEAQDAVDNQKIVNSIKEQTKAQLENRENLEGAKAEYDNFIKTTQDLYTEYQNLSAEENLSAEQKTRLGEVCDGLQSKFTDLNVSVDENGVAHINNSQLITDNISYLSSEGLCVESLTSVRLSDSKACSEWSINNQNMTYAEVCNNIENYKTEIDALSKLAEARDANAKNPDFVGPIQDTDYNSQITKAQDAEKGLEASKTKIDAIYGSIKAPVNRGGSSGGGYIHANPESSGGSKKGKSEKEKKDYTDDIEKLKSEIEPNLYLEENNAIKGYDNELEINKTLLDSLEKGSKEYREAQLKEIDLYKQKQEGLTNLNTAQKMEAEDKKQKLTDLGFEFDANGKLISSQQTLLDMQEKVNALGGSSEQDKKDKQEAIKNLKEIKKETDDYTALVGDKIPKTTAEWNKLGNEISKTNSEMKKADEDALKTLRDNLVNGLKKEREDEKEDKLEKLDTEYDKKKERIQKEYDQEKKHLEEEKQAEEERFEKEIKNLQKQLSDLDELKENKAEKLKALQSEYSQWTQDDSSFGKKNRDELAKEIKDLQIEIQKDSINKQINSINEQKDNASKSYEDEIKETDDHYKKQLDNEEKHYNKMKKSKEKHYKEQLDEKKIYAKADELITSNSSDAMLKILNDSSESYKDVGFLSGKNFKDAFLEQIQEGIAGLKDLTGNSKDSSDGLTLNNKADTSGISGKVDIKNLKDNESYYFTTTKGNKYGVNKNGDVTADVMLDPEEQVDIQSHIATYDTGGRTPSNIPSEGKEAILHADEKVLNKKETEDWSSAVQTINDLKEPLMNVDEMYKSIMNSGGLMSNLVASQQFSNLGAWSMPNVSNSNLSKISGSIINRNETKTITQPVNVNFNGDIVNNNLADKALNMNEINRAVNNALKSCNGNKIW